MALIVVKRQLKVHYTINSLESNTSFNVEFIPPTPCFFYCFNKQFENTNMCVSALSTMISLSNTKMSWPQLNKDNFTQF